MRTLLDLATVLSTETLERAVDDAHRRGLIRMRRLAGYLAEPANAALPGSGELRRIVEHRDPDRPIASELESGFFAGLRRVGLPTPTPQHRVVVASGRERFIDFAYPNQKVAIELDGYRDHATPAAFVSDRVRQNEIQALGWRFFRFTWDQVMSGTIAYLIPLADGLGLEPSRWRPKARRQRFNASRPRAAQPVR